MILLWKSSVGPLVKPYGKELRISFPNVYISLRTTQTQEYSRIQPACLSVEVIFIFLHGFEDYCGYTVYQDGNKLVINQNIIVLISILTLIRVITSAFYQTL